MLKQQIIHQVYYVLIYSLIRAETNNTLNKDFNNNNKNNKFYLLS